MLVPLASKWESIPSVLAEQSFAKDFSKLRTRRDQGYTGVIRGLQDKLPQTHLKAQARLQMKTLQMAHV